MDQSIEKDNGGPWQRLPRLALLPVGLYLIRKFLSNFLPAVLGAGAGLALLADLGLRDALLGLIAISLLILLYAFAWHRRFAYCLGDEAIYVRRGVFHRQELRVAWDRVRNVDLRQAFYLKPLDMVTLVLETPGGESEEIQVHAMPKPSAIAVREHVTGSREYSAEPRSSLESQGLENVSDRKDETDQGESVLEQALHQPGRLALFLHGIISGQFLLIFAGAGVLYGYFHRQLTPYIEYGFRWLGSHSSDWIVAENQLLFVAAVVLGLLLCVTALLVLSGLIGWVRYFNFRLAAGADTLRSHYGLLETRERTLRHTKLQAVTLTQTVLARWAGLSHMKGHQASSAGEMDPNQGDGIFLVPAISPEQANTVVSELVPSLGEALGLGDENLQRIDRRFQQFWWSRLSLLLLMVIGVLVALGAARSPFGAGLLASLAILGPSLLWPVLRLRWRWWGWALHGECLVLRSGFLGWSREAFEIRRIQQVRVCQSPFQRRVGLANLECWLADYGRVIPFISYEEAVTLSNYLLHALESEPELLL